MATRSHTQPLLAQPEPLGRSSGPACTAAARGRALEAVACHSPLAAALLRRNNPLYAPSSFAKHSHCQGQLLVHRTQTAQPGARRRTGSAGASADRRGKPRAGGGGPCSAATSGRSSGAGAGALRPRWTTAAGARRARYRLAPQSLRTCGGHSRLRVGTHLYISCASEQLLESAVQPLTYHCARKETFHDRWQQDSRGRRPAWAAWCRGSSPARRAPGSGRPAPAARPAAPAR